MATQQAGPARTPIYLELGSKRVFACALEWPGWCRAGRSEEAALLALAEYAPRYAVVATEAGLPFPATPELEVVERLPGTATTDFGAPDARASGDSAPLSAAEAERLATILAAAWKVFDRVAARVPAELLKGPRGGGRDRDSIVEHVLGAETEAYARKVGVRIRTPAAGDGAAIAAAREAILDALRRADGAPLPERAWPPRYAVRRIAWHVLDHAWEMEDRST